MKKTLSIENTLILKGRHGPDVRLAAKLIQNGHLVAIPTETVYGLAALGNDKTSIEGIYRAKQRPNHNPLILHVHSLEQAFGLWDLTGENGQELKKTIQQLAKHFWPGPLTLVAPKAAHILPEITAGLDTLAVRCPAHPTARELLKNLNTPLAAPSANLSNRPSPTCAGHVMRTLSGRIKAILDGGPCSKGLESTVFQVAKKPFQILRAGSIDATELQRVIPHETILSPFVGQAAHLKEPQRSPGQQSKHYAPAQTSCILLDLRELKSHWNTNAPLVIRDNTALKLEKECGLRPSNAKTWLMPDSAHAYAKMLYRTLYEIENSIFSKVWVEMITAQTAYSPWWAIQDRWVRASK